MKLAAAARGVRALRARRRRRHAAQGCPTKPVKLVVPFTAGSATDILARTVGQKLTELWGQPVVVDNRPGAGGTIGAAIVAKAPPRRLHAARAIRRRTRTTRRSIRACRSTRSRTSSTSRRSPGQPNVLVVAPSTGYKTVADLIAAAKAKPGALNFGSAGTGSGTHINAEKFRLAAGIDVVHIPYKGTPEALTDTMTGRITYFFSPISAALPHVQRRQARRARRQHGEALERAAERADDRRERACPGFDYNLWVGLFAPAGTPADIVDKIARDVGARARDAGGQGAADRTRRRGDADDAGGVHEIRRRGDRRVGQGDQGGEHQGAVASIAAAAGYVRTAVL